MSEHNVTASTAMSASEMEALLKGDTKVKVAAVDADGVLRGKMMSKGKFLSALNGGGFGFSCVLYGWDINDNMYDPELLVANREGGYGDLAAFIDAATFRRLPWEDNMPFFLVKLKTPDIQQQPLIVDPRTLLSEIAARGAERGWKCIAGAELEYFQFLETPESIAQKGFHGLKPLTPGMHGYSMLRPTLNAGYFHALYDEALRFGIEIEGHHTETGPGVYETALAYTDAEKMADNVVLYKLLAKSVGMRYGVMPTFMAKPYSDLPGCSGHIHVSLRDADSENLFALSKDEIASGGRENAYHEQLRFISQEAEWFLGGLMDGLADVMPMFCPTINSYKRIIGGSAMWAPDTVTYGYDCRPASIRIISPPGCPPAGTRFEFRIPGADMNAHYALAAIFALGLRGIANKMTPQYGPLGGDGVTRDTVNHLPTSLEAAVKTFKRPGSVAREVFGDYFVDHFAGSREHELAEHRRAVTSWEVERYFELV